jgi:hypothetical protein
MTMTSHERAHLIANRFLKMPSDKEVLEYHIEKALDDSLAELTAKYENLVAALHEAVEHSVCYRSGDRGLSIDIRDLNCNTWDTIQEAVKRKKVT